MNSIVRRLGGIFVALCLVPAGVASAQSASGDADNDGRITEKDANHALAMSIRREAERPDRADMDGDGRVTSRDAAIILHLARVSGSGPAPEPPKAGVPAPSVVGLQADEAKAKFPEGVIIELKPASRSPEDPSKGLLVVAQDPPPGTLVKAGDHVVLTTNPPAKPPEESFVVPDLVGHSRDEVEERLPEGVVARFEEVKEKPSSEDEAGQVVSQNPRAGKKVRRGAFVTFRVYGEYRQEPSAKVVATWPDEDVERDGEKGMLLHVSFYVFGCRESECIVSAYFLADDGTFLRDQDGRFATDSGKVSIWESFLPDSDEDLHSAELFFPYSQLHLEEGSLYRLSYEIQVHAKLGGEYRQLVTFDRWDFTVDNTKVPTGPRAEIQSVTAEHNVTVGGKTGMRVRTTFAVHECRGSEATAAAYFCFSGGQQLILKDGSYCDADGWICTYTKLDLAYDHSEFTDLELFMPYAELHLKAGALHELEFRTYIEAKIGGTWKLLARSDPVSFTIDKRSSPPACSGTCAPGDANHCSCEKWGACGKDTCRSEGRTTTAGCTGICAPAGQNSCSCKAWGQCGKEMCLETDPFDVIRKAMDDLSLGEDCGLGLRNEGHCRQGDMKVFECRCSSAGRCGNRGCRGR